MQELTPPPTNVVSERKGESFEWLNDLRDATLARLSRISAFMAFCLQCTNNPEISEFYLENPAPLGIKLDPNAQEEDVDSLKRGTRDWIAVSGFAEMTEIMSTYFDDVYIVHWTIANNHIMHRKSIKFIEDRRGSFLCESLKTSLLYWKRNVI